MILDGAAIGLAATVLMDIWAKLFSLLPGQGPVNWGPVGRWVWALRTGRVFHNDIGKVAPYAHESALGWAFHYFVGIVYGILFTVLAGPAWLATPTYLPAWIFGMVTIGAGWFLLQPALGLGWAASRLPQRWTIRALNIVSHSVFALGLWGSALALG